MIKEIKYLTLDIKSEFPLLWKFIVATGLLAIATVFLLWLDTRNVTGEPVWIKPLKFEISIVVYLVTIGAILTRVKWEIKKYVATTIGLLLFLEILIILLQAARGVRSHFNVTAPTDRMLYAIMGMAIVYNTYLVAKLWWLSVKKPQRFFDHGTLWFDAIRQGLFLFLLGSVFGGYMATQKGHSVGIDDGGPGLPFTGWSTVAGDLRVAHFVGLHGIHVLFLLVWFMNKWGLKQNKLVTFVSLVFTTLTIWAFVSSVLGRSLFEGL